MYTVITLQHCRSLEFITSVFPCSLSILHSPLSLFYSHCLIINILALKLNSNLHKKRVHEESACIRHTCHNLMTLSVLLQIWGIPSYLWLNNTMSFNGCLFVFIHLSRRVKAKSGKRKRENFICFFTLWIPTGTTAKPSQSQNPRTPCGSSMQSCNVSRNSLTTCFLPCRVTSLLEVEAGLHSMH